MEKLLKELESLNEEKKNLSQRLKMVDKNSLILINLAYKEISQKIKEKEKEIEDYNDI